MISIDFYYVFLLHVRSCIKKLPPVVLMMAPLHNEVDVNPTASISIHFAPFMNEKSVSDGRGVKLLRLKTGESIQGEWKSYRQGPSLNLYRAINLRNLRSTVLLLLLMSLIKLEPDSLKSLFRIFMLQNRLF